MVACAKLTTHLKPTRRVGYHAAPNLLMAKPVYVLSLSKIVSKYLEQMQGGKFRKGRVVRQMNT